MLNKIWLAFFFIACASALGQWLIGGDPKPLADWVSALFNMAELGFEIAIGLVGVLALWLGLFRIGEKAGLIEFVSRGLEPLLARLMPEVPRGHPAHASVTMNMAANMLGLDNAATPLGLKAMGDLQTLNQGERTATNAQILFLVLNTSSVTLLPVTIFMYRAQQGAEDPAMVFIPILLATSASTLVGLMVVAAVQRLRIWDPVVLAYLGGGALLISSMVYYFGALSQDAMVSQSKILGHLILMGIVTLFLAAGARQRLNVYETFIEGAKEGFEVGVKLIPYLVAMLVAIGVFRASGALEALLALIESALQALSLNTDFVPALTTAFMKPLSGSGARAMMVETMNHHGVDAFPALIAAVMQGSTETTFYVLAVYFGSVGITHMRHAVLCGLLADAAGIVAAILLGYWFFA